MNGGKNYLKVVNVIDSEFQIDYYHLSLNYGKFILVFSFLQALSCIHVDDSWTINLVLFSLKSIFVVEVVLTQIRQILLGQIPVIWFTICGPPKCLHLGADLSDPKNIPYILFQHNL